KNGSELECLGLEKLKQYIEDDLATEMHELIVQDLKNGVALEGLQELEKLLLIQKNIIDICNNFVSFPEMYDPESRAMFEAGRLVIDGRIFNFNIPVIDVNKHAKESEHSGIYLMYSEVSAADPKDTFYIVTPVTSQRLGNLGINKRGTLYDIEGKQWDTKVLKVIENPVSLVEAMIAPFKKIAKLFSSGISKITSSTEKTLEKSFQSSITNIEKSVASGANGKAPAKAPINPAGLIMSGSLAFAAIGSTFAFIAKTFKEFETVHIISAISCGLGILFIPVMIIAMYKLNTRNLSTILESSGWAINTKMRLTSKLAKLLAPLPIHPDSFKKKGGDALGSLTKKVKKNIKKIDFSKDKSF
ncbi:MAG: hypothetical protein HRT89_04905, partial [Lentisphaeria bacterium]|nr:hypothetical protein [Lentisphaeria bacterium]